MKCVVMLMRMVVRIRLIMMRSITIRGFLGSLLRVSSSSFFYKKNAMHQPTILSCAVQLELLESIFSSPTLSYEKYLM